MSMLSSLLFSTVCWKTTALFHLSPAHAWSCLTIFPKRSQGRVTSWRQGHLTVMPRWPALALLPQPLWGKSPIALGPCFSEKQVCRPHTQTVMHKCSFCLRLDMQRTDRSDLWICKCIMWKLEFRSVGWPVGNKLKRRPSLKVKKNNMPVSDLCEGDLVQKTWGTATVLVSHGAFPREVYWLVKKPYKT